MPRTAGPQPPGRRAPADRLHPSSPARYCRANSLSAPAHQPRAHPIRPAASSTARPGSIAPQLIRDDRPPDTPTPPLEQRLDQHLRHTTQHSPLNPTPPTANDAPSGTSGTASKTAATTLSILFTLPPATADPSDAVSAQCREPGRAL
jgi:hypothetical protein